LKEEKEILKRKNLHIELCLNENIDYSQTQISGFENFRFDYDAVPEIDFKEIDTSITLFNKKLSAPLIIGAMTGGTKKAQIINERLALAAEATQIGMALGSQRAMLLNQDAKKSYQVKNVAKNLPLLFGNLGAIQLNDDIENKKILELIRLVEADAFYFHLNPLQEVIQNPNGNLNFKNLLKKINDFVKVAPVPVLVKEVGHGLSETTLKKLSKTKIHGIETSGLGGTSWAKVEAIRAKNSLSKEAGFKFALWGVTTVESLIYAKKILKNKTIIASGGIRNGIEIAKSIALGAQACAMSLPFLKAASISTNKVIELIEQTIHELKIVMFLVGAKNIKELSKKNLKQVKDYT
jgi:isopentenyl-diphosphate delta-isomerase